MPGNVRRDSREKIRQATQFVIRVVKSWNQKGHDFQPYAHFIETANGIENWREASAKLMVVTIVKTLQFDFVEIDPGPNIFENLWRSISIRNKSRQQSRSPRLFEYGNRPLCSDQRF